MIYQSDYNLQRLNVSVGFQSWLRKQKQKENKALTTKNERKQNTKSARKAIVTTWCFAWQKQNVKIKTKI